jgi:hypothetical protein
LAEHERVAHRKVLRHFDHRVIDRRVAVRVVLAEHIAHHNADLRKRAWGEAQAVHRVEDAAVHRLEAVAHIGERAVGDDRHCVVDKTLAHLG